MIIFKRAPILVVLFVFLLAASSWGQLPWDVEGLSKAPGHEWVDRSGRVHSLLYRGLPYKGEPTRVFAVYASPHTLDPAKPAGKYPAVVLVHGGGGNAFPQWAELYAKRGYAAIAMDLGGNRGDGKDRQRLPDGGPPQDDQTKFRQADAPDTDQWTYHAVADVVLAHSLLRSFPEVDPDRTAIVGISWGGYLTCITAGVDQRFKAAVPMYGCGFIHENSAWVPSHIRHMSPEWVEKWVRLWDPSSYVGRATMPMFFVNGSNDPFYPLDSYAKTYELVKAPKTIRIEPNMNHTHWFDHRETFLFIDEQLKGATPLPRITAVSTRGEALAATVKSPTRIVEALLHYTKAPHTQNKTRSWTTAPLQIDDMRLSGQVPPPDATAWYITIKDTRGVLMSSEIHLQP